MVLMGWLAYFLAIIYFLIIPGYDTEVDIISVI